VAAWHGDISAAPERPRNLRARIGQPLVLAEGEPAAIRENADVRRVYLRD